MMRIGFGYDVHRLVEGRPLIIGGVNIPFSKGLLGHSDADVLIHSLIDSLLGALAMGDIGKLFPDNDQKFKNINSRVLLREVYQILHDQGYILINSDITVCAQEPRLSVYIDRIRENIAEDLGTSVKNISVKATTEEGLGISGSSQGISSYCVSLISRQ